MNNVMGHPEEVDVIVCGGGPAGIFSQPFFKFLPFSPFVCLLAFSPPFFFNFGFDGKKDVSLQAVSPTLILI